MDLFATALQSEEYARSAEAHWREVIERYKPSVMWNAKYEKITEKKWESCRRLGFSFGYNQAEGPDQVIASHKLIELFVDVVSENGNLLLNIGPGMRRRSVLEGGSAVI